MVQANLRDEAPHPVDVHVGRRLRILRRERGVSQGALGLRVGVAYQQIQKYETGANRIAASVLYDLALALGAPVDQFYVGLPLPEAPDEDQSLATKRDALLTGPAGMRLIVALSDLPPQMRPALADLIAGLGQEMRRLHDGPSGVQHLAA